MADQLGTPGGFFADADGDRVALQRYHSLVNALDAGIFQCDADLTFVALNDALLDLTGYERSELLGRHVSAIFDDVGSDRFESAVRALRAGDAEERPLTVSVGTAEGDAITCEIRASPLREEGRFRGVAAIVSEVDGPDTPGEVSKPWTARLRDNLPAMVYRCRNERGWPMTVVSDGCEDITGYEAAAVESGAVSWGEDVIHPDDRDRVWETVQSGIDGDGEFTLQYRVRTADGDVRWVWERGRLVDEATRSPAPLEGVITDITEQKYTEVERGLLSTAAHSIAGAETFADGLQATLRDVCELTDWEYGEAWMPAGDGSLERLPVDHYRDDEFEAFATVSAEWSFGPGEGLPGTAWETGEPCWIDDVSAASAERFPRTEHALEAGLSASLGVPITEDDEVLAVLAFHMREARSADERLVALVSSTAAELGELLARREVEETLEREKALTDRILETAPVGIAVFDPDGDVVRANDRMGENLGLSDDVESYSAGDLPILDEDGDPLSFEEQPVGQVLATGEPAFDEAVKIRTPAGETRWLSMNATPITDDDDSFNGVVTTSADVTRLKEQAAALERRSDALERELDDVFERVDDAFYALDEDFRFTYVNERAAELLQASEEELLGERVWEMYPEATDTPAWDAFHEAMETQEQTSFEVYYDPLEFWVEANVYPSESGLSVYFRDVTDRKEYERELEQYRTLTRSVNDVIVVMDEESTIRSVNPAVEDVFGYEPDELVGEPLTELMAPEKADAHRQGLKQYLEDGVRSIDWEYVELTGRDAEGNEIPLAVSFSESEYEGDRYFTGVVRDITERKERERELERQRMRLATLAHLNDVVNDVTNAVVERSTREEIEQAACDRLVESESYTFAWIAEVDAQTEAITPRTEVGVDGYLEEIPLSADADDSVGQGPAGRAVRTKEMQVSEDVFSDPDFEPWREYADEYGFRSFAAIPIVHEGTLYGVMGVYSERHGAFTDEERDVLGQLGEVVGHAIASVERKQALMGDEVTELVFQVEDPFSELDVETATEDRITFDRMVPIGGDDYLVYGTAAEADLPVLESLVEALPHWEELRVVTEDVDHATFELTVTESRILASVASRGGDVREAFIDDGDYRMTVQVPPSVDVRSIADVVTDVYPSAELRAQRQVTRERDGPSRVAAAFENDLTDRQRNVVESAYFAGYFEWPRESSGEDLAESLDIAPATFSQHLRTAQNRIVGALFENRTGSSTGPEP